ncbi:YihY/virulence factor BrkB family protein [Thermomicrobium sp.]
MSGRSSLPAARRWFRQTVFWRAFLRFRSRDGALHASAIAYSALLALGPFLLFLAIVTSRLLRGTIPPDLVLQFLLTEVPQAAPLEPELRGILTRQADNSSGRLALVTMLLSLWSTSALGAALRRGLRAVAAPERPGSFVRDRLYGIGATVGVLGLALLWFTVGGIVSGIALALPAALRFGSGLLASFVLFVLLYRFLLPAPSPSWRLVTGSALATALAWEATKFAITAAVQWLGGGSAVYGLLGAVTGILVATNLVAGLTLYGAALITTMTER